MFYVHSAIVLSSSIRPIDTSFQALGVKRTKGFVRACGELAQHRELLAHPPSNSDDSSDEHDSFEVTSRRRKVNICFYHRLLPALRSLNYSSHAPSVIMHIYCL